MEKLKTKRQEKERGVSVDTIIQELNESHLNQLAVVGIDENNELVTAYSLDNRLELIGLLETLKTKLIDEMNYIQD